MSARPVRAVAIAALVFAASAATAYVRSRDAGSQACLYWQERSVAWVVNPGRYAPGGSAHESCVGPSVPPNHAAIDAVQLGFAAWTSADPLNSCTNLALPFAGLSTSASIGFNQGGANQNLVVFREGWCSQAGSNPANCFDDDLDGRTTIALTTVTYAPSSGRILDADMELNGVSGAAGVNALPQQGPPPHGWNFTCVDRFSGDHACTAYGEAGCFSMDLQNTVAHEAGHFIGLGHVDIPAATMFARSTLGQQTMRDLAGDDRDGLCDIYPAGGATLTCVASPSQSGGDGGCGSAGGAGLVGALLAAAALLPRARRRAEATRR